MERLKEWGPLIALAGLMLASQWHLEQRIEERLDATERRIEGLLVALEQRVNGLAERIARVEGLLSARAAEPVSVRD